jgi:uroporphyrinogen decarboxylase
MPTMNTRERFLAVLDFNREVHSLKWDFGIWGETIDNWYAQGLPKKNYPVVNPVTTTPTASLYAPAWLSIGEGKLSKGLAVMAGGLYWPTQSFPLAPDVTDFFGMDASQQLVDVNLLFDPMFEVQVLHEDEEVLDYIDVDGVQRRFLKSEGTIPNSMKWPITDKKSWEKLKAERLNTKNLATRFPSTWEKSVQEYRARDYPLALGGYPHGFFGTLSHLIGYENLFFWYHDEPALVHDILNTFTELWIAVYSEVLAKVSIDHWHIWEDISYGRGSMISLPTVREYMLPYLKRVGDFLKARGVRHILLDTDGDCNALIPLFLEAGVTGMYPFETHCGMDIVKVRQQYPKLQMLGGISKGEIAKGKARIDEILKPVEEVLKTGGYIPFADHFVPPDVSFEDYSYFRNRLNTIIDRYGR